MTTPRPGRGVPAYSNLIVDVTHTRLGTWWVGFPCGHGFHAPGDFDTDELHGAIREHRRDCTHRPCLIARIVLSDQRRTQELDTEPDGDTVPEPIEERAAS